MKLYLSSGTCSLSPHIALREAGLAFELEPVDMRSKLLKDGKSYLEINPKGYVPALEFEADGVRAVLSEGPAIVQYIADQNPSSKLAPAAGTLERYRLQEWLNFISSELHKQFSPLFNPQAPDAYKEIARANLNKRFATLNEQLAKTPYLLGDTYSVADGYAFTVLRWTHPLKIDLTPFPAVVAFMARIGDRPAVKAALEAEKALK